MIESKIQIKEVRIYFENKLPSDTRLAFRIFGGTNMIYSSENLTWNRFCRRWEIENQISLNTPGVQTLQFQILKVKSLCLYKLLAEGTLQMQSLPQSISEELKICLTTRGQVVGWLYGQLQKGKKKLQKKQHFISMHKLTTTILDMRDEDCSINIYLNNTLLFIKQIRLKLRKRIIFPNLKEAVKKSDLLIFQIDSRRQKGIYNMFLIDHLQSGETAFLKAWVRNNNGNKMGDFELQYFLQNFYLPNNSLLFSSLQIEKTVEVPIQEALTKKQRQDLRFSVHIESFSHIESNINLRDHNALLHKVVRGERRRRNLMLPAGNRNKVKKKTSLQGDRITQKSSLDNI